MRATPSSRRRLASAVRHLASAVRPLRLPASWTDRRSASTRRALHTRRRAAAAAVAIALALALVVGLGPGTGSSTAAGPDLDRAPAGPDGDRAPAGSDGDRATAGSDGDRAPAAVVSAPPLAPPPSGPDTDLAPAQFLGPAGVDQAPPRNDDLASAIALRPAPFTDLQDLRAASREPREAIASCDDPSADERGVWYVHTPAEDGLLAVTTAGSLIDTVLSAWKAPAGTAPSHPLEEISCNDDAFDEATSALVLRVRAGEPLYIKTAGFAGTTGFVQLHVVAPPRPPTNDDRAQARAADVLPFQESLWTATATDEDGEAASACAAAGEPERGAWYRHDLTASGAYIRAGAGDRQAVISAWAMDGERLVERGCAAGWLALDGMPGERLYVKVADPGDGAPTIVQIENRPPPPGNDNLAAAEGLSLLPVSRMVSLWTATDEAGEVRASCAAPEGEENGVWYRFTAPAAGAYVADGIGPDTPGVAATAAVISAWRGDTGHPLEEIGCARADGAGGAPDHVVLTLDIGEVVHIKLGAASSVIDSVPFNLIPVPPNDDLAGAMPIAGLPFGSTIATRYSSLEPGEARPTCEDVDPDGPEGDGRLGSTWYRLDVGFGMRIAISGMLGAGGTLSLWSADTGTPSGPGPVHPLVELACAGSVSGSSVLVSTLPEVGPVWLRVTTLDREVGAGTLSIVDPGPPPDNDARADAAVVASLPFTATLLTLAAGDDPDEPRPSCDTGRGVERGVWFAVTPPPGVGLTVASLGSLFPVVLSAWVEAPGEAPRELGCARAAPDSGEDPFLRLPPDPAGTPGAQVLLKVAGADGAAGFLALLIAATPDNDDLADALPIDELPFADESGLHGATYEPDEVSSECGERSGAARGVWYRLVPPDTGTIEINTFGSDFDTVLSLWRGAAHPLDHVACNDDASFTVQSSIAYRATAGETIWIRTGGFDGSVGNLVLNVTPPEPPPANDDLSAALDASRPGFSSRVDSRRASGEPDELPSGCGDLETSSERSVWYRVTATRDELVVFDTLGSEYDTVLSAWRGDGHPLEEIDCNDDDPETGLLSSRLTVEIAAGETIHLKVSPLDGESAGLTVFSRDGYRILLPALARNADSRSAP